MKILVTGANGQLGTDICSSLKTSHEVLAAVHEDADIRNADAVHDLLDAASPECVINTAAMHNVESCENDPLAAYHVNAIGTKNLANACREGDIFFVHISTDYVFDGKHDKPYTESDAAMPLNVYGNTKLSGENYALAEWDKSAVIRVGGIYGKNPCRAKGGLNFVQLMLKLAAERPQIRVVDDEIVTPTPTAAIANQVKAIVENGLTGLFHATCQGQCSWHEFAKTIFELNNIKTDLQKAAPGEFPAKVRRPSYSVLENRRLKEMGLDLMPHWKDALQSYL